MYMAFCLKCEQYPQNMLARTKVLHISVTSFRLFQLRYAANALNILVAVHLQHTQVFCVVVTFVNLKKFPFFQLPPPLISNRERATAYDVTITRIDVFSDLL